MVDGEEKEELDLDVVGKWAKCYRRVGIDQDGWKWNPKGEGGSCESEERV